MTRLETILETVAELLEGSKRKWSEEKRMKHADATATSLGDTAKRESERLGVFLMRQNDDRGERGHRVNRKRYDAREKLGRMQGIVDRSGKTPAHTNAVDTFTRAVDRYIRKLNVKKR
jgi:hypothetical protein